MAYMNVTDVNTAIYTTECHNITGVPATHRVSKGLETKKGDDKYELERRSWNGTCFCAIRDLCVCRWVGTRGHPDKSNNQLGGVQRNGLWSDRNNESCQSVGHDRHSYRSSRAHRYSAYRVLRWWTAPISGVDYELERRSWNGSVIRTVRDLRICRRLGAFRNIGHTDNVDTDGECHLYCKPADSRMFHDRRQCDWSRLDWNNQSIGTERNYRNGHGSGSPNWNCPHGVLRGQQAAINIKLGVPTPNSSFFSSQTSIYISSRADNMGVAI